MPNWGEVLKEIQGIKFDSPFWEIVKKLLIGQKQ